ncbi:glycosyltransferase [candidate division KSB1 bacterium]|nr:glycosyltransferase [candidate division KSB1 bacterium]
MEKIKVLQLVEGFNFGGAETKLLELVRHLDKGQFETTVIGLGLGGEISDLFLALDCRVLVFKRQRTIDFNLLRRIRRFIRDEGIEIVMSTLFYADIMAALAGHKAGAKGVFCWETISSPKWLSPHRLWAYRYAIRQVDKVISVSNATAQWLIEKRKLAVDKVIVIPYGVDIKRFNPKRKNIHRQDIGCSSEDFIIGQVSRLNEQKGHIYLIDVASKILQQIPKAKFVWIGDGPLRSSLEKQIVSKGLEKHFIFLGFRNDVADILPLFDVFTLPSLYEGLPNVVLEAMACALPVIATPADGTKEAVMNGETGFLVAMKNSQELADRIIECENNAELRRQLGARARKRVEEHFCLEKQIEQFEALYLHYGRKAES